MGIALMGNGSVVCPFAVGMWCFYDGTEDLSTIYPGTKWQKMEGRFLFGSNSSHTVGTTGGEESHKLTIDEMPNHRHSENISVQGYSGWSEYKTSNYGVSIDYGSTNYHSPGTILHKSNVSSYETQTDAVGGDQPHNNMPPYYVTNMWKRIA